ncbi:MAG: efflux RND transporter periplasmic adaptor subunit [Candidatus Cloacimonadota bacterium]|nr:MAG: efflux RND transporter periplasmic adaptor subunit [Candidatus Cloacimonadota bacterium]
MRKVIIIVIIIIVMLALVFLRMQCSRGAQRNETKERPLPVEVTEVIKGDVISSCEVLGTIKAKKRAEVFPETMGRITRIMVQEGSHVYKNSRIMAVRNESIGFKYEEGFIKSPISGNISAIMVDVGSMVSPQTAVAEVVDYSLVKVSFNIAETDIDCISKSSNVFVENDGLPGETFKAKVTEISPVIDEGTRTVSVKAIIDNPERKLKPGMTARVRINLGEKTGVLMIPKDAYLKGFIFVVNDSIAERREVSVGVRGNDNIEIIEGLEMGEKIVVIGQERLSGGEKVNPIVRKP